MANIACRQQDQDVQRYVSERGQAECAAAWAWIYLD